MTGLIRGKVAQVLNTREIVINAGSANGVEEGMYFDVLSPHGYEIEDPDTGEVLGVIERPKVRVRIKHVQDKLSVAATYRTKRVNIGGVGNPSALTSERFSRLFMPPKWITKYETLKTGEKTWDDLDEEDSYVGIGDPVVQVIEENGVEQESANN